MHRGEEAEDEDEDEKDEECRWDRVSESGCVAHGGRDGRHVLVSTT